MAEKIILISGDAPAAVLSALKNYGEVRTLPPYERLPAPVMSHCDMLMCRVGGKLFVWKEYFFRNRDLFTGIGEEVVPADGMPSFVYPGDVGLDLLTLENDTLCFGHEKTACAEVLYRIKEIGGLFVPVKQGYTRCSVLKVSENAIITADEGIAREAAKRNISSLVISAGGVDLPGYDTGFIGGASAVIGENVLFFGNLSMHKDHSQIADFIRRHGLDIQSLSSERLTDCGGLYSFDAQPVKSRYAESGRYQVSDKDRDDFWNIDAVVPKRRLTGFSNNTEAVKIDLPVIESDIGNGREEIISPENRRQAIQNAVNLGLERARQARERKNSAVNINAGKDEPDSSAEKKYDGFSHVFPTDILDAYLNNKPVASYSPANPLISDVVIYMWRTKYTFYDRFAADAERYYRVKPDKDYPPVPFYSYNPQFSQMDIRQRGWYFCWREKVRGGEYPPADYAYILLLIAETINEPDLISPTDGLSLLVRIWKNYRQSYAKLDQILCEAITDWCLINRLDPPFKEMGDDLVTAAVKISRFPEFWQKWEYGAGEKDAVVDSLIRRCSKYDYHRSKFYSEGTPEIKAAYDRHIKNSVMAAYEAGCFGNIKKSLVPYSRSSYTELFCAWKNHRRISIRYLRFDCSARESEDISDLIKYSENRLREALGIKSRLSARIPENLSEPIDSYFSGITGEFEPVAVKKKNEDIPSEYEAYYEPLHTGLSFERAGDIERESWRITDALVSQNESGEEEESYSEKTPSAKPSEIEFIQPDLPEVKTDDGGIGRDETDDSVKTAVRALLDKDMELFSDTARQKNMLPEALLDLVNERLYDLLGDTAAEVSEGGFAIIDDYKDDVTGWLGS